MARFDQVPAEMLSYATYELATKLAALTPLQRAAIARIVDHVYVQNKPISELLRGDGKIAGEANYYRRGRLDEATGAWRVKPGWAHDVAFQEALNEARRLAIQVRAREEMTALAEAKRRARLATGAVVGELVSIATGKKIIAGQVIDRNSDDKDRIAAGKTLLDYAGKADDEGEASSEAADWWAATEAE